MPAWWAPTGRSASIPSCIAARRNGRAWCSASIAAAIAAASPTGWPRPSARKRSTICARASRSLWSIARLGARVWLDDDPQRGVHALCYMVDRGHRQYAGRLTLAEQLHYVRQGHGRSGPCREYVLAAVKELEALGCRDADLHTLGERLKGIHEQA